MDLSKQSECVKEAMTEERLEGEEYRLQFATDLQRHHVHVVELREDWEGLQQSVLIQPEQHYLMFHSSILKLI